MVLLRRTRLHPPQVADQFEASIVWMSDEELIPGRGYWLKLATQTVTATVAEPKYEVNVNTMEHLAAKSLDLNSIGVAEVTTDKPIIFERYEDSRQLGGFIDNRSVWTPGFIIGQHPLRFSFQVEQHVHAVHRSSRPPSTLQATS